MIFGPDAEFEDRSSIGMGPVVSTATAEEWPAALELFFQRETEVERTLRVRITLDMISAGSLAPDAIFVSRQNGKISGVMIAALLSGGAALCWPPQIAPAHPGAELENLLVDTVLADLQFRGACFGEALLTARELASAGPLLRHGFVPTTVLSYLEAKVKDLPARTSSRLTWTTYRQTDADLFARILSKTYENTQDCPELDGLRPLAKIITGYLAEASGKPDAWWMALSEGVPAGVLIMIPYQRVRTWDMSYVGLVPAFRKRGLGTDMVSWALHRAAEGGAERVTLAVDIRNGPAQRMYARLGFVETERRHVLLKRFAGAGLNLAENSNGPFF